MNMNYAYWLANVKGVGNRAKMQLLDQVGSAEEVFFLTEKQVHSLQGLRESEKEALLAGKHTDSEAEYAKLCGMGISFLSLEDTAYPEKLRHITDAPYGIYLKGRLPDKGQKTAAVVGARMCSDYGYAVARKLGQRLGVSGVCVISGMARGIDSEGHWGALAADGMTCAVLGCGVDVCYPASGRKLYDRILERGGILSEYPPGTPPLAAYFPARNRIISALADVVVVVEAKEKSGSLITADFALEQGKEIYAVPGRLDDALSAGCNTLIRQGAGIISDVDDFIKGLDWWDSNDGYQEEFTKLLLEKEESMVYSCLSLHPTGMEILLQKTGLSPAELSEVLEKLQQRGFITETFKNYYIKRI